MSQASCNLDLHIYLAHFPPDGQALDEGTAKAVAGLAGGAAHGGARVTVVCDGKSTTRTRSPRGDYDIACLTRDDLQKYVASLNGNSLFLLNGMFHPRVYALSRLLDKRGVGYVVAPHDPYHPSIFQKRAHLKWPYWFLRERPMLRRARAVQVLDDRHAQFLKELGVQTQVIATCNGFSPEDLCPAEQLRWSSDGPIKLLFLGRLDAFNKGLDLLIQAIPGALECADVRLTIQGPDWGDLQQLQKLANDSKNVSFLSPDYQKRPWQIIAEHDVLCLPSRFEGFGLAAMEGMLAARVLVISEIAGIARHVRASGCGLVIEPNVKAIRDAVLDLINRRDKWKEMGLAGREYALKNFQWDRIAEDALRQYARVSSR